MTDTHRRERTDARPRGGSLTINPKFDGTRGYTLVEMMIVLVVMGVMISFGIPQFCAAWSSRGPTWPGPTCGPSGRPSGSTGWITAPTPPACMFCEPELARFLDPVSATVLYLPRDRGRYGNFHRHGDSCQPTPPGQAPSRSRRIGERLTGTLTCTGQATSWSASSESVEIHEGRTRFILDFGSSVRPLAARFVAARGPDCLRHAGDWPGWPVPIRGHATAQLVNFESRFMASSYIFKSVGTVSSRNRFGHLRVTILPHPILQRARLHPNLRSYYYYLVPWNNPWAQKLTTRAQLLTAGSNPSDPHDHEPRRLPARHAAAGGLSHA